MSTALLIVALGLLALLALVGLILAAKLSLEKKVNRHLAERCDYYVKRSLAQLQVTREHRVKIRDLEASLLTSERKYSFLTRAKADCEIDLAKLRRELSNQVALHAKDLGQLAKVRWDLTQKVHILNETRSHLDNLLEQQRTGELLVDRAIESSRRSGDAVNAMEAELKAAKAEIKSLQEVIDRAKAEVIRLNYLLNPSAVTIYRHIKGFQTIDYCVGYDGHLASVKGDKWRSCWVTQEEAESFCAGGAWVKSKMVAYDDGIPEEVEQTCLVSKQEKKSPRKPRHKTTG